MIIEHWPIEKIRPYPKNAKKHKVKWISKSISEFSFDQPIVVNGNGTIIKGHGRYEAAKELGMETVPVIVRTDLTKAQEAMARIADNRTAQGGGFDMEILVEELEEMKSDFDESFFDMVGLHEAFLRKLGKEDLFIDFDTPNFEQTDIQHERPGSFALAIVLTQDQYANWQAYKDRIGKKTDTTAFLNLLESAKC